MPTYVALLRGINVGGHKKVSMAELREMFAGLGFVGARSLLQSGNVVFESPKRSELELETLIEDELRRVLNTDVVLVVRSAADLQAAVAGNPFPHEAGANPGRLIAMFTKTPVDEKAVAALQAAIKGPEIARAAGGNVYIYYPDGMGTSKLTPAVIERSLGCRVTGRNWNTVLKLAAIVA